MRSTRAVATRTQAVSELFNLGKQNSRKIATETPENFYERWRCFASLRGPRLPAIRDLVDHPGVIVRHEHRAVRHHEEVHGASPRALSLEPAFGECFVACGIAVLDRDERHPIPDLVAAVPGAVLRDEDSLPVLLGKRLARVKAH